MLLIKPSGRGGGRGPRRRRPKRFSKRKPLTVQQKAKIFDLWVQKMRSGAAAARKGIPRSPKAMDELRELVSEGLPAVKVEPYIEKLNSGEVFSLSFGRGEPHFTVVPDGFLSGEERFALQRVLSKDLPGRRVLTFSEFEQLAMKNIDFAALRKDFNL